PRAAARPGLRRAGGGARRARPGTEFARWPSPAAPGRPPRPARSVFPVPLLAPRVSVVVVAEALPETRLVLVDQLEPAHPLRALPQVQVRDEQPRRPAVLGCQRLAVVPERHP